MICSDCDEQMSLVRLGCWSLSACYECKECEGKGVLSLRELENPSSELINMVENPPLYQPDEYQREWLKALDVVIQGLNGTTKS